jgi:predicted Zn-dependent protease
VLGEFRFRQVAERALAASRADQTEIVLIGTDSALTRFANSTIHQNVNESDLELRARVVFGKRIGVASTNDVSPATVSEAIDRASAMAEHQREDPDFAGLPRPATVPGVPSYDEATASFTPAARARAVKVICDLANERGLVASGGFSTGTSELAVANSLGLWAYARSTSASLKTVVMGDDSPAASSDAASGYAERVGVRVEQIDAEAAGREAVDRALRSRGAATVEPGDYEVVIEEYAVAEALSYLSYIGFGALALHEGHSFLAGRLGGKIVADEISIWDDGSDPRGLPCSFDFEGVPKQRVSLIERGVARGVVYDTRTATRAGTNSTGHALPAPNTFGPLAWNLFMAAGDTTKERMVAAIRRGLIVTRFHYVNVVHPRQAILTGMTRDGTFLIENGEITRPVRNLRFTQNILDALSVVRGVGSELAAVEGFFGASVVPALHLARFNFTGVTTVA